MDSNGPVASYETVSLFKESRRKICRAYIKHSMLMNLGWQWQTSLYPCNCTTVVLHIFTTERSSFVIKFCTLKLNYSKRKYYWLNALSVNRTFQIAAVWRDRTFNRYIWTDYNGVVRIGWIFNALGPHRRQTHRNRLCIVKEKKIIRNISSSRNKELDVDVPRRARYIAASLRTQTV